ncbi:radical SAM protein [Endozoicomonas sp. SM1973]|uniref:Radical SAM protein n=1 Tax=Spartinivicinus marinus TaxID=2994442 RepID=A0A853HWM0_9GAMM|nr:radical SAM protein [Spartinivicinus marinus]MCX4027138.1 radical SAM protein [Spartinivicinus marinus]NYZ66140.1 radical SAM protein [Spartinivicinus marinus]
MELIASSRLERSNEWHFTSKGEKRGYIQPRGLDELWFHIGTACNLSCSFCLEGSKPGDNRLQLMRLADVKPFIHEALTLGVQQFSFTGGEPFVAKDMVKILNYAAQYKPCLVLTNGTDPVLKRMDSILSLKDTKYPIAFRISLDYVNSQLHDQERGEGSFVKSLQSLQLLHHNGFKVSIARQMVDPNEDKVKQDQAFYQLLSQYGLPDSINIIAFPNFFQPGSTVEVPEISETCMTTYHTEESRQQFMCAYSKMLVKVSGKVKVYACTLVDDDKDYEIGNTLTAALTTRISLKHHRCFSCFAHGASCSE